MSKSTIRNAASLTARLSALMLVAGALAPAAFAKDATAAHECDQATEQARKTKLDQATARASTQSGKPVAAPAARGRSANSCTSAARAKPANPCAPAPRKKKVRNPCA